METLTVFGVEIFSAGKWNGDTYTEEDLDAMVAAHNDLKSRLSPPVKLGHNDEQKLLAKDGFPAAGWIVNLYRQGKKLIADLTGIPKKIADLMRVGAYRKRSAEIFWDYEDPTTGKKYSRVLCGLALLGEELPAVSTLDDILALYGIAPDAKSANVKSYVGDLDIKIPVFEFGGERKDHDDQRFKLEKTNPAVGFAEGSGTKENACEYCRMYRGKWMMECAVVEGVVRPSDTCKLYQPIEIETEMAHMSSEHPAAEAAHSTEEDAMGGGAKDKEPQRKDAAAEEAQMREKIREEEREKARKEYEEAKSAQDKKQAETESRLASIEEERERDKAIQTVKSMSSMENMRVIPALVPLATYLLHQIGKPQPRKYAEKEGAAPVEIRDAFLRFLNGLPNLHDYGLFDEKTHVDAGDGNSDVWTFEKEMKAPADAVQRRIAVYKKEHPEAADEEALEVIEKGSAEGKALVKRYFSGHAGRR